MKNNSKSFFLKNVGNGIFLFIYGIFFLGTIGSIMIIAMIFLFIATRKNPFSELPDPVKRSRNYY